MRISWDYDGTYPPGLPIEQAFVHTGLYLGWLADRRLVSDEFEADFAEELRRFRARDLTGPALYQIASGALAEDMLNAEGDAFTRAYYVPPEGYLADYAALLSAGLPSAYHVPDSWANYRQLKATLDRRFQAWLRAAGRH